MKIKQIVEEQRKNIENAVYKALDVAYKKSDAAEVTVQKKTGISIITRYGELENMDFHSDGALWITVYCKNKKGSASSTDLNSDSIVHSVHTALDMANYNSPDHYVGIAEKNLLSFVSPDLDLFHPIELVAEQGMQLAERAENAARSVDKRIINNEGGHFNSQYGIKVFGNSHGMLQSYCSSKYSLSTCVIAEHNGKMERDYSYTISCAMSDLESPEWIGKECARRTIAKLAPHKISTIKAPVLFSSKVATGLFGHLITAISGNSIYSKSTFLLDALGKQILPKWLTIEEQPHLLKGLASKPFDSEGVRTQYREIVKDGVLQTWLLTSYTARKLGLKSTGHSGGIHNWRIIGNEKDFPNMLQQLGTGLLVTELMGQGVNNVTGDYSIGAVGFWIEKGNIQYPVNEITIAGNLKDMLRNIVSIGGDIDTSSDIQCGSVLLPEMKIAGK